MSEFARCALIVDDNLVNLEVAAAFLRREGWTVTALGSGAQALDWLATHPVDVVLLDLSMPGLSGEEVCRRLRSQAATRQLYVIAYTAHALEHERARIRAGGFDDILVKPISRDSLLQAVAPAAARRAANASE